VKNSKLCFLAPFVLVSVIHAGNVVTDWNVIAATTIVTNAGKGPAQASVWFTYSSLAVYDAVNAITGQYQPFYYHIAGPSSGSIDAAAGPAVY